MKKIKESLIPIIVFLGLVLGLVFHFFKGEDLDHKVWLITLVFGTIPLGVRMLTQVLKGRFGIDIIAMVAIVTSFFLGEYFAGTIIVLMLSGGEALEDYALKRSGAELSKLLSLAPTKGHIKKGETLQEVEVGIIVIINALRVNFIKI
jgi:cation transport ATPase